ncbi:dihydrofolate reductase [Halonatronum saccharophilum]|uniref:dihydrofolate reductase n=1 Tax=Halonatronum saccharophilum TaxID=150060 RepID=UPI00048143DE|nr:dihydrofolate reductase [Halonatronum saccharophilum]
MNISMIVATDKGGVIGKGNKMPWDIKGDLRYFKEVTTAHPIIMGRKTYQSIGKALPGRKNFILTRDKSVEIEGCIVFNSLDEALDFIKSVDDEVFIIGGAKIYSLFLPWANKLYITKIDHSFVGDTFFPKVNWKDWEKVWEKEGEDAKEGAYNYKHYVYKRVKSSK